MVRIMHQEVLSGSRLWIELMEVGDFTERSLPRRQTTRKVQARDKQGPRYDCGK
jgi:hypothetical protein